MVESCVTEGLPEPEFKETREDFYVTLNRSRINELLENPEMLNDRQKQAIEYLKTKKTITSSEYKKIFECSERTARSDLNQMVKLTVIKKIGKSKNIRYVLHEAFRQFPAVIRQHLNHLHQNQSIDCRKDPLRSITWYIPKI